MVVDSVPVPVVEWQENAGIRLSVIVLKRLRKRDIARSIEVG
jgi:hypothetical protein